MELSKFKVVINYIILIFIYSSLAVPNQSDKNNRTLDSTSTIKASDDNLLKNASTNLKPGIIDSAQIIKLNKRIEELNKECELLTKIITGLDTIKRVPIIFECFDKSNTYYVSSPAALETGEKEVPCTLNIRLGETSIFVSGFESYQREIDIPKNGCTINVGWKNYKLAVGGLFTMLFGVIDLGFGLGWGIGDKDWKEASLYGFIPGACIFTTGFIMIGISAKNSESFNIIENKVAPKDNSINFNGINISPIEKGCKLGLDFTF